MGGIDSVVEFLKGDEEIAIMKKQYVALVLLPLFIFTDYTQYWQIIAAFWTTVNVVVRTQWPCSYNPAQASTKSWISSPFTARIIATFSEFLLYITMAVWAGTQFFGALLGWIVIVGEIVCWAALINQSEFLNWIEDFIWAMHASYMAYLSTQWVGTIGFSIFAGYLLILHLPRMGKRISRPLLNPLIHKYEVVIAQPDLDTRAWVVPMLCLMPLVQALMFWQINGPLKGSVDKYG